MLELRVRASQVLRCAFCHDALLAAAFDPCVRCGTCLHEGCWREAERCPVLGCAPPSARPRVVVPQNRAAADGRDMRLDSGSVVSGTFGWLLCAGSALVLPAFLRMFGEVGHILPWSTELVVGVPNRAWWLLSALSLVLLTLKDRWVRGKARCWLNALYVAFTLAAGLFIVGALFAPGFVLHERL